MAQLTLQQAFETALKLQQAGRLREAEQLYQQILSQQPAHAGTLHYLGVLAHQQGRNDAAIELIQKAIEINPHLPEPHNNLGLAYKAIGRSDDAIASFKTALAQKAAYPGALYNLGVLLHERGEVDEAIAPLLQAITLRPGYAEAHNALGLALAAKGQFAEAMSAYRQAIAARATYAEAYNNIGSALKASGDLAGAVAAYRQAIALKPNLAETHNNLGIVLMAQKQFAQAIAAFEQAITIDPRLPQSYFNLGNALGEERRLEGAIAAFRRAISLKPQYPQAYENLAKALRQNGQLQDAVDTCRELIALDPRSASAHVSLGIALKRIGQMDEAIAAFRTANALDPKSIDSLMRLAAALKDTGKLDHAIAALRAAMALAPDNEAIQSNLLYMLHFHPDYDAKAIAQEHQRWGRRYDCLTSVIAPHANGRNPDRRLRIGYVSPDFRDHVVGRNVLPLFREHDRRQFEIFCYAQVGRADALTGEFQRLSDRWTDITKLSDDEAAARIREDRIDILVDLALHMNNGRLLVFARKPAPVQATFAGYPGGTGLSAMGYRLSDPYLDPPGMDESVYVERTIRLPDSFWCYDPLDCGDISVGTLSAATNEFITFGCLNNFCKINDAVLELWSSLMRQVQHSRLILMGPPGSHRVETGKRMAALGVDAGRIEFVPLQPRRDYLGQYHRIDIGLDSFPYNGHTTSLDALWMGVPIVTLVGRTAVTRAGLCQLRNLDLPELAAETTEQFVQIAVALASDLPRLAQLRLTLRQRMEQSPLMDAPRFARNIESAYRKMWTAWCETAPLAAG